MKKIAPALFLFHVIFWGCIKKDKPSSDPEPQPEKIEITELTSADYIQNLEIPGAAEITFDSVQNAYLVTLPENYLKDEISIKLKLYPEATVAPPHNTTGQINFLFKNSPPLLFDIKAQSGNVRTFKLYVKHVAKLKVVLNISDVLYSNQDENCLVAVDFISGVGTVPETPGATDTLFFMLKDGKSKKQARGYYGAATLYFQNVKDFLNDENLSIEATFGSKTVVAASNLKFSKVRALIYGIRESWGFFDPIPTGKKLIVEGNGFTASYKYSVKIESDFLSSPVVLDARFESLTSLSFKVPMSVPDGSYSITYLENGEPFSSRANVIGSKEKAKSIGQVWLMQNGYPTGTYAFEHARKISVISGGSLLISPFPAVLGTMYQPFDPTLKLPVLQLMNPQQTLLINANVKGDPSYGDGTIVFYYGQYDIPSDTKPGFYEARLVYDDQSESLPYWNRIEIK
jgi:hypothetical protein